MDSEAAMGLYIIITTLSGLAINILFYRLVFKKQKRMRANAFSWLSTLGIMLPISFFLIFPFTEGVTVGTIGGAIGFGLIMVFVIAPIFWFVPSSFYTMVRAIYIASTKKREREILTENITSSELDTSAYEMVNEEK
ncbi:MAG TPA: hypothetical protein VMX55_09305 [candidate division Zixibacteria bacterium]|nr:hypothetical protein [candidate division Zixibacteria bacterium]